MFSEDNKPARASAVFRGDDKCRLELRRWFVDNPIRWLVWMMLNPSDANAEKLDPTTNRVTHFTKAWGYDGWIVVNVVPFISSDPRVMWKWLYHQTHTAPWDRDNLLRQNEIYIEKAARIAARRVVAFGAQPAQRMGPYLQQVLSKFQVPSFDNYDHALYCLGRTKDGSPIHPLARGIHRVPDDREPILFAGSHPYQIVA